MIEQRRYYVAKCDICHKEIKFVGFWFRKAKDLRMYLKAENWKHKGKKWFCPKCQKGKK